MTESAIPKIIFQTWKSRTDLPTNFAYWSQTFRDKNPSFTYRIWDDVDNRAFIANTFPWFLPTYDAFPAEIYRADAVRYFFLYRFGGFYADLDTECLKPLDPVLDVTAEVILGRMGYDMNFEHSLPNAVMASKPRAEFWLLVFSLMMSSNPGQRPEYTTGPVMLKTAVDLYTREYREDVVQNRLGAIRQKLIETDLDADRTGSRIGVMPPLSFYPVNWADPMHEHLFRRPLIKDGKILAPEQSALLFPNSLVATYWSHSWEEQP